MPHGWLCCARARRVLGSSRPNMGDFFFLRSQTVMAARSYVTPGARGPRFHVSSRLGATPHRHGRAAVARRLRPRRGR